MLRAGCQLCQRPQHEGILQDLSPRQGHSAELADQVTVGEDIDVQLPGGEAGGVGGPAVLGFDVPQAGGERRQRQLGAGADHHVHRRVGCVVHVQVVGQDRDIEEDGD